MCNKMTLYWIKIAFYSYTFIICGLLKNNCLPKWPAEEKKLGITEPYLYTANTDGYIG